ncbi:MAG: MFS transporter, partial [Dehalococcoidia bacterium]|nr:MFS transporter [Dehalococcoidia bacterium]
MSRYLIFGVIVVTLLTQSASSSAIAVAFPEITSAFNVSVTLAGWVLSIFFLATIVIVPLSGKASDVLGRKRTFMFFVSLFTAGSLLCALAQLPQFH